MTSSIDKSSKIIKLVRENPRREGTIGHAGFELYKGCPTVAKFQENGGRLVDLRWDIDHGYVELKKSGK